MPYGGLSILRRIHSTGFAGNDGGRKDATKNFYSYVTTDAAAVVEAAAYFNANTELVRGDVIMASMNNGVGATPVLKFYIVTQAIKNSDANNVIALQTTIAG